MRHRRGDERPSLPPSPSWSSFAIPPSLPGPVGENLQTPKPMINVFISVRKMTNCTRCAVCGSLWTNGWWKTGTPTGLWWRWWWRTTWTASTTSIRRMSATKGDSSSLYLHFLRIVFASLICDPTSIIRFKIKEGDLEFRDEAWCNSHTTSSKTPASCKGPDYWRNRGTEQFLKVLSKIMLSK